MHITVIIPFRHRGDAGLLNWTLEGFANQQLAPAHTYNILVGIDGGSDTPADPASSVLQNASTSAPPDTPAATTLPIAFHNFSYMGAGAVRNALVKLTDAKTDLLLFLNADTRPAPGLLQRHIDTMSRLPPKSLVLGDAPWERPPQPTVFDAFIAETQAIFAYPLFKPGHFYNYRCCWTLNLSVRRADFMETGGFREEIRPVYYEDLEFGFRMFGTREAVFYDPAARVLHRHPTTLDQYLDREELLGLIAPVLQRHNPQCFATLFGTNDPPDVLAKKFAIWLDLDAPAHKFCYKRLCDWAPQPEALLGVGNGRKLLLATLYQMHVPLKRMVFRLGFLKGMGMVEDWQWKMRKPEGIWRRVVGG